MTTRTAEDPSRMLAQRDAAWPVVSLYLDVDGRRHPSHDKMAPAAAGLLHRARELGAAAPAALLEAHLTPSSDRPFDRHGTGGLALFADSWSILGEVRDQRPFPDTVTVNRVADLLELEDRRQRPNRLLVVLVDRANARLLDVCHGTVAGEQDVVDPPPRGVDDDRGALWTGGFDDHLDEVGRRHLRRVVGTTVDTLRGGGIDGLVLAGPDETVAALTAALPADAASRLFGRLSVPLRAAASSVLAPLADLVDRREATRRAQLVADARQGVANGSATIGLADTLRALLEQRVRVLLVERGYQPAGACCEHCNLIMAHRVGACPYCPGRLMLEDNVTPGAVGSALRQDADVVALDPGTLGEAGRIAALCRY